MRRAARILLYLGTAAIVLAFGKIHAVRHEYDYTGSFRFAWSFAYILILCVAAYGVGFPDLVRRGRAIVPPAIAAAGVAALGISLLQLLGGSALLPRFVVFGSATALVGWFVLCAAVSSGGRSRAEERDRVVVVAERDEATALEHELAVAPERNAQVVAVLGSVQARSDAPDAKPLVKAVLDRRATVVVLARPGQLDESIVAQAASLHEAGVRIRTLSLFYEEWLGKLPISELERVSLMFDIGELHRARYGRVKRLFDLAFGLIGFAVLAVATPFVAVGNLAGNRGPLLYRQERVGRNGKGFEILKFRTMRPEGAVPTNEWTTEDDPRITPFGRILRRSHLDELPQAVNILRGDLSVVGPRPEQPRYVAELAAKIPFYNLRHLVRPGLTGWAQVKYGYAGNEADALEKLQYEFFYLRRQGVLFDLRIIGRTVRSVLGRGGR